MHSRGALQWLFSEHMRDDSGWRAARVLISPQAAQGWWPLACELAHLLQLHVPSLSGSIASEMLLSALVGLACL